MDLYIEYIPIKYIIYMAKLFLIYTTFPENKCFFRVSFHRCLLNHLGEIKREIV